MTKNCFSQNILEKFSTYVASKGNDDCWEWTSHKNNLGYGMFYNGDKTIPAHRYSYSAFYGDIPANAVILHKCDNPSCVNPNHLKLGTQSDNILDMYSKGRRFQNCIFYAGEAWLIKKLASHKISQRNIAKMFKTSQRSIGNIIRGYTRTPDKPYLKDKGGSCMIT